MLSLLSNLEEGSEDDDDDDMVSMRSMSVHKGYVLDLLAVFDVSIATELTEYLRNSVAKKIGKEMFQSSQLFMVGKVEFGGPNHIPRNFIFMELKMIKGAAKLLVHFDDYYDGEFTLTFGKVVFQTGYEKLHSWRFISEWSHVHVEEIGAYWKGDHSGGLLHFVNEGCSSWLGFHELLLMHGSQGRKSSLEEFSVSHSYDNIKERENKEDIECQCSESFKEDEFGRSICTSRNTNYLVLELMLEFVKTLVFFQVEATQKLGDKFREDCIIDVFRTMVTNVIPHVDVVSGQDSGNDAGKSSIEAQEFTSSKEAGTTMEFLTSKNDCKKDVHFLPEFCNFKISLRGLVRNDLYLVLRCLQSSTEKAKKTGRDDMLSSGAGEENASFNGAVRDNDPTGKHFVFCPAVYDMVANYKGSLVPRQQKGYHFSDFLAAHDGTFIPHVNESFCPSLFTDQLLPDNGKYPTDISFTCSMQGKRVSLCSSSAGFEEKGTTHVPLVCRRDFLIMLLRPSVLASLPRGFLPRSTVHLHMTILIQRPTSKENMRSDLFIGICVRACKRILVLRFIY